LLVQVCDFGLITHVAGHKGELDVPVGDKAGTPGWKSPEQTLGQQRLTLATDIYSFGMLAVMVLTGEELWGDLSAKDREAKFAKGQVNNCQRS
jgi:serine/threonine protein kinase